MSRDTNDKFLNFHYSYVVAMAGEGLLKRHQEIRSALSFFLQSWYKHKQVGSVPDPSKVMFDYIKFKSYKSVLNGLHTAEPQVVRKETGRARERSERSTEARDASRRPQ